MSSRWNHPTVVVDRVRPAKWFVPGDTAVETERRGFVVRERGAVDGHVTHAYRCPEHGLFDATVPRRDVPDEMPCPFNDERSINNGMVDPECDCLVCSNPINYCGVTSPWAGSFCGQGVPAGEVKS